MFDIRVEPDGRVVLSGRFDAAQSEHAQQTLRALSGPVDLECSGLEYISSAGIAVIMDTYKRLSVAGHALRLVGVTPRVRNVFVYAGLDKLLGIA